MTAPEVIEYVVVPINRDEGEIDLRDAEGQPVTVSIDMVDLGANVTAVLAPGDLPREQANRLMALLKRKQREANDDTTFLLLQDAKPGDARWDFVRLVRKDKWDASFAEERVDPPKT